MTNKPKTIKEINKMNPIIKFLHDVLDWGFVDKTYTEGFDGLSCTAKCKYCDYQLLQDSTGAWFHASTKFDNPIRSRSKQGGMEI